MKVFKGNYGWSTTAHSKNKEGKELKCYVDMQFAKSSDPNGNETEGDLLFRTKDGREYSCFFSSYEKKGIITPKLVLMPMKQEQTALVGNDRRDMFGHKQEINDEEIDSDALPFY